MTAEFPDDARITLAHGAGGRQTATLIARVFARHFQNPDFTADDFRAALADFATRERRFGATGDQLEPTAKP